jgi:hypothetical protein
MERSSKVIFGLSLILLKFSTVDVMKGRKIESRKMFGVLFSAFDLSAIAVIGLLVIALALRKELHDLISNRFKQPPVHR